MSPPSRECDPAQWYSTNLVGVPARVLAGVAFNAHPLPLHVAGVAFTSWRQRANLLEPPLGSTRLV